MNAEKYKKKLKNQDRVISAITKDGKFRIAAIKNTNAAKAAQERHSLPSLPAFMLARQLAAASMLAVFLKGEERIILEVDGSGLIQKVFAEAIQVGEVRGFTLFNSTLVNQEPPTGKEIFGDGTYKVTRVLYSKTEPVTGVVPLQNGDISSDLSYYFFQSEQIPSAVILDTKLDEKGNICLSSGFIVQALPGTTNEDLQSVYKLIANIKSLNDFLDDDGDLLNLIKKILPFEIELMKNDRVDFFCRCSKESFIDRLTTFGLDEIKSMRDANHSELICQYCNAKYELENDDFEKIIISLQAKQN